MLRTATAAIAIFILAFSVYAGDDDPAKEREKLVMEYHQAVAKMPRYARDALWALGTLTDYSEKFTETEKKSVHGAATEYFYFVLETGEMQRLIASGKTDKETLEQMRRRISIIKWFVIGVRCYFVELGNKLKIIDLGDGLYVPPTLARAAGEVTEKGVKDNK